LLSCILLLIIADCLTLCNVICRPSDDPCIWILSRS
jgi:hypothetical protein